jgi:presenilin-like A22 family membrane protease
MTTVVLSLVSVWLSIAIISAICYFCLMYKVYKWAIITAASQGLAFGTKKADNESEPF